MDPISAILGAITAGAVAASKDAAADVVKQSYLALKDLLVGKHEMASLPLLDKEPDNPVYRSAVEAELSSKGDILKDELVFQRIEKLRDALQQIPDEEAKAWGIDVGSIKGANIGFENVTGSGGGIRAKSIEGTGDVSFKGISGGQKKS